jgi:hypothetical protein
MQPKRLEPSSKSKNFKEFIHAEAVRLEGDEVTPLDSYIRKKQCKKMQVFQRGCMGQKEHSQTFIKKYENIEVWGRRLACREMCCTTMQKFSGQACANEGQQFGASCKEGSMNLVQPDQLVSCGQGRDIEEGVAIDPAIPSSTRFLFVGYCPRGCEC